MEPRTRFPFESTYAEIETSEDIFIDAVFGSLQSSFLLLPRGPGFLTYQDFQEAYEVLKRHTAAFTDVESEKVMGALEEDMLAFVVLRTILGFTPPELANVASKETGMTITQNFARDLDRQVRIERQSFLNLSGQKQARIRALVTTACNLLQARIGEIPEDMIHRLDKADTRSGLASVNHLASEGVPYAMLLYERFLGRPFASHRDAVSELVGEVMENAVEEKLRKANISFRKTKRAERIEGFDQAPDFIVPDEWNPQIVIEAKITEDDGTARDKVTRIQHLAEISNSRSSQGQQGFQVVACIDGRGFGVRREDMRKLLAATDGKIFTLKTLDYLVKYTDLQKFVSTH
ncbi:MAG: hypothetical protein GWO38_10780 [Phycisphaerae bacterium]|nr:hypothetical protein [Phycisphaerae bacterium]NIW92894.1 hypothetical protein [Phycisphaerae bacterium]NIX28093.1 hypothetical protein [Phycisphaerae bacterium]